MAPARRLRSFLARVFRYLADAVQPGTGAPVPVLEPPLEPLPAAAAGNEHWFAVVRERAPELLTGGGIHAGGVSPRRQPTPNLAAPLPAAPSPPAPQFTAIVRRLRRRLRLIRRRPVRRMPTVRMAAPVAEHRPAEYPEPSAPVARTRPPLAVGFDTSPPRTVGNQPVSDGDERRPLSPPRLTAQWPVTPGSFVTAPAFEPQGNPTRQQWPSFERAARTSGEQPEFPAPEERSAASVWLDERRDDDRWPELPDDEMLWEPASSTFSSHDVTRLDDEQRGW
ncbi:hypothetical protein ACJEIK_21995 [Mycobacterium sp. SMC-16]|uniref:hypothetical protein n=1 Tax=Mycobacterium sp. SMC-16 TaxID=3385967 RepID=UPI002691D448